MSSSILHDERVQWIRQRVVISLDMSIDAFNAYFTDSLERARSAGVARETLSTFLTKNHSSGSTMFFACEKWTEEIEGN